MAIQLFTAVFAADDERCVNLPGFSHWGEARMKYKTTGPMVRTVYFFAKHRRQASKHLNNYCGVTTPCDLSEGKKSNLLTPSIAARVEAS